MAFLIDEQTEAKVISRCKSLRSTGSPKSFRNMAWLLAILMGSLFGTLIAVPWQQSVFGKGEVTVFSPMNRPQMIQSQIDGRILKWHVQEGEHVKEGQLILSLQDIDPKFLDPAQIKRMKSQREALLTRQAATNHRIEALNHQIAAMTQSRGVAIPSAGVRVEQATSRILAARQAVIASEQNVTTAQLNYDRTIELNKLGLRSTRDKELAEQALIQAKTQLEQSKVSMTLSARDQNVSGFDRTKIAADTEAAISSVYASMATAQEALATTNSDLAKLDVEISAMEQRIGQRTVKAPQDGVVVRVMNFGMGETVAPGEPLAIVSPEHGDQAVALYMSGNDAPLLAVGRPVRLQFAGWPAIQFTGWPSVAVGTFAGKVAVIDAVSDQGTNRYRILVKPDVEAINQGLEQPWPNADHLRPGTEAAGWVMLDTVPLWFELWRQFNAFPPTVNKESLGMSKGNTIEPSKQDGLKEYIKKPKKK